MFTSEPTFIMLCGAPGCRKGEFLDKFRREFREFVVVSSDEIIHSQAQRAGKTYAEVFQEMIEPAKHVVSAELSRHADDGRSVVLDQTNLTPFSRHDKLRKFFYKGFNLVAIYFEEPEEYLIEHRNPDVPESVVLSMASSYTRPDKDEGFNYVFDGNRMLAALRASEV